MLESLSCSVIGIHVFQIGCCEIHDRELQSLSLLGILESLSYGMICFHVSQIGSRDMHDRELQSLRNLILS